MEVNGYRLLSFSSKYLLLCGQKMHLSEDEGFVIYSKPVWHFKRDVLKNVHTALFHIIPLLQTFTKNVILCCRILFSFVSVFKLPDWLCDVREPMIFGIWCPHLQVDDWNCEYPYPFLWKWNKNELWDLSRFL